MNADGNDLAAAIAAAFAALAAPRATGLANFGNAAARDDVATPTPFRLAVDATFAVRKAAVRRPWVEALHPRGRNIPDVRGRINRGEFGNKPTAAKAPKARRAAAQPAAAQKSPMTGVSHAAHEKAREHATRAVERAKARGHRHLQRFADRAEDNMRATIASLKAAGHSPLKGTLAEHEAWLYAVAVLKSRMAREALAGLAGRAARPAGGAPGGEVRQPVERGPVPKQVARLMRFTSAAVRRRILHAFRNEAELARAVGGLNLDDSEAADVVILAGATGELVTDPKAVKTFLRIREDALRRSKGMTPEQVQAAGLGPVLNAPLYLLECKTLVTSRRSRVTMSAHAVSRKRGWERRYGASFHTVIFDDRRGKKFSGSRLWYRRGVGNTSLSKATPVADFGDLLGEIGRGGLNP
jgi:hypothetical protein